VAIDGSDASLAALCATVPIARALGASLTIVEVIEPHPSLPGYEGSPPPRGERTEWFAEERFVEARQVLEESGVTWERIVCEGGDPAQEICAVADEGEHDLVAMGAHEHSALMGWLTGSVSDRVARRAPCAVLVVREDVRPGPAPRPRERPGTLGEPSEASGIPPRTTERER